MANVHFVTLHLMQDLSALDRVPLSLAASVAQASDDVVFMKAGPARSQGAINRGERPLALSVMRLNQTSLSHQCFIELYFSFHSAFQYG